MKPNQELTEAIHSAAASSDSSTLDQSSSANGTGRTLARTPTAAAASSSVSRPISASTMFSKASIATHLLRWVKKGQTPRTVLNAQFLPLLMPATNATTPINPQTNGTPQSHSNQWLSVGRVSHETVKLLRQFDETFDFTHADSVRIRPEHANTASFSRVTRALRDQKVLSAWRDELYPVTQDFSTPTPLAIERASSSLFGITTYGSHMNGYVCANASKGDTRPTHYWVSKRSLTKSSYPGYLDNLAAGGIAFGSGVAETMRKELKEEAGIDDPEIVSQLHSVGFIEYQRITSDPTETEVALPLPCLKHGLQFVHDLPLPVGCKPQNTDGEVDSFRLVPIDSELIRLVCQTDKFKFNCNLVIADFLVRHGFVSGDDPDYCALIAGLRLTQHKD